MARSNAEAVASREAACLELLVAYDPVAADPPSILLSASFGKPSLHYELHAAEIIYSSLPID